MGFGIVISVTAYVEGGLGFFHPHLRPRENDRGEDARFGMRDIDTIRVRLEQVRGQLLQWGTPDLRVFVIAKDELHGWIRALEWVLVGHVEQTLKR